MGKEGENARGSFPVSAVAARGSGGHDWKDGDINCVSMGLNVNEIMYICRGMPVVRGKLSD